MKEYYDNMVMNPQSIIRFNYLQMNNRVIKTTVDFPVELLVVDPYFKPTVKEHILNSVIEMSRKICGDKCLQTAYNCTIEDNWPPGIGDTVVILEGVHKGKQV